MKGDVSLVLAVLLSKWLAIARAGCAKSRSQNLIWVSHVHGRDLNTWTSIHCSSRCMNKGLSWKQISQDLNQHSPKGCLWCKWQLDVLCYKASRRKRLILRDWLMWLYRDRTLQNLQSRAKLKTHGRDDTATKVCSQNLFLGDTRFSFQSLQVVRWGPSTLWTVICMTQSLLFKCHPHLKHIFMELWGTLFDQMSGSYVLLKLKHKMNHHVAWLGLAELLSLVHVYQEELTSLLVPRMRSASLAEAIVSRLSTHSNGGQ